MKMKRAEDRLTPLGYQDHTQTHIITQTYTGKNRQEALTNNWQRR